MSDGGELVYGLPNGGELVYGLPNGCTLYWYSNPAGGRAYYSDEIGGGVLVWDTSLVDEGTLLAAMAHERKLAYKECVAKREHREA